MPGDVTIFAASYVVFIEALLGAIILAFLLYDKPKQEVLRWVIAAGVMLVVSYMVAKIGGAVYSDPRPFAVEHFRPLIAHAPDNGFPSDHALLAAAIVAAVALARLAWAAPVAVLAVIVDAARVGAGIHHPIDVLGSDVCVVLGAMVAVLVAPHLTEWLLPYVPSWVPDRARFGQRPGV